MSGLRAAFLMVFFVIQTGRAFSVGLTPVQEPFAVPPNEYRIVQYGKPDPNQIRSWKEYGIGGCMAFFHDGLRDPADPRYADITEIPGMLSAAQTNGFKVWLADDYGYPSGMAGGTVVEKNPEYEVRGLVRLTRTGEGAGSVSLTLPDNLERIVHAVLYPMKNGAADYSAGEPLPFEGRTVSTKGQAGSWRLEAYALKIINEDSQAQTTMQQFGHSGRYPDLLNADAVASFLNLFHARIEKAVGDLSGKVEGFYSNEPNLMRIHFNWRDPNRKQGLYAQLPWNDELPARFAAMHGYDLMPKLGALFEGDGKEDRRVRLHFQMTVADLLAKNFSRQIREWCAARGIRSGGHFLLNEYLSMHVAGYGDMMKFVAEFDVPALDIGIPNPDGIAAFPYQQTKFFSSVAAWKERTEVICLPDPIIGGGGMKRLSPAIPLVRNTVNMAFLHGANQMTSYLHLHPMDRDGQKADGYTPEEYTALNEYIGRISLLLKGAKRETGVALFYPIQMFQADYKPTNLFWSDVVKLHAARQDAWEQTEHALLDAGLDYEIVHPEALENASVEDGSLKIGWGNYRYLVMPQVGIFSKAALEKLHEFEAAGGTVLWVDQKPEMAVYARDDSFVLSGTTNAIPVSKETLPGKILSSYDSSFGLKFDLGGQPVSIARFRKDGQRIYYLVNRSQQPVRLTVLAGGSFRVMDPSSGLIRQESAPRAIEMASLASLMLVQ
jgi:hypothetical protein